MRTFFVLITSISLFCLNDLSFAVTPQESEDGVDEVQEIPERENSLLKRIEDSVDRYLENMDKILSQAEEKSEEEIEKEMDMQLQGINQKMLESLVSLDFRFSLGTKVFYRLLSIHPILAERFIINLLKSGGIPNLRGSIEDNLQFTLELSLFVQNSPQLFRDPKVQALYYDNAKSIKTKTLRRFAIERLDSLFNYADYLYSIGSGVEIGKAPAMESLDIQRIRANLKSRIEHSIFEWLSLNQSNLHLILLFDKSGLHDNKEKEDLDSLDLAGAKSIFDNELTQEQRDDVLGLADSLLEYANRIYELDFALLEYLDRVEQNTPVFMLDKIRMAAENNFEVLEARTVQAYIMILTNLGESELLLPHRKLWVDTMEAVSQAYERTEHPMAPGIKAAFDSLSKKVKEMDKNILEALCNQKSSFFEGCGDILYNYDGIIARVRSMEIALNRRYPNFHSFSHQFEKMARAAIHTDQLAQKLSKTNAPHKAQKISEELTSARIEPISAYLNLECYLYQANDSRKANSELNLDSFMKDEKHNIEDICPHNQTPNIEKSTIHFVTELTVKDIYKNRNISIWQTLLSIPVTLAAAEASGLFGHKIIDPLIGRHVRRFSKNAVERSKWIQNLKNEWLRKKVIGFGEGVGERLIHAFAGAIVFTAVQRSSMALFGLQPLWQEADPNADVSTAQQFWNNYGSELVFGGVLFFVLPYVQGLYIKPMRGLAKVPDIPLSTEQLAAINRLSFKQEAALVGSRMLGDTVVFAAVPYVERSLSKLFFKDSDDIWLGWETAVNDFLHSAAIGTAFASFGNFKHRVGQTNRFRRVYLRTAQMNGQMVEKFAGKSIALKYRNWMFQSKLRSMQSMHRLYDREKKKLKFMKDPMFITLVNTNLKTFDLYRITGLDRSASKGEIDKAYRFMSNKYHPDKGGDITQFQKFSTAFEILRKKREEYDRFLNEYNDIPVNITLSKYVVRRSFKEDLQKATEIPGDIYIAGKYGIEWLQQYAKGLLQKRKQIQETSKDLSGYDYPQMNEVRRLMDLRDQTPNE